MGVRCTVQRYGRYCYCYPMLIAYSYSAIGEDNGLAVLEDLAYRRGVLLRAILRYRRTV
jgi:hypothetical protein